MASWLEEMVERAVTKWLNENGEALALKLAEKYITPEMVEKFLGQALGSVTPAETPELTPEPEPQAQGPDDIDPSTVTWVGDPAGVQGWKITSDLEVGFSGGDVLLKQDGTKRWPEVNNAVANPWVIAQINGEWCGASFEWMRRNADRRAKSAVAGDHIKVPHTFSDDWRPRSGETVYFMVAALSRGKYQGKWTWFYNKCFERTAIRKVVWP